jgi:hypothetical protein
MRFVILFAFISFYSFGQNEKTEIEIDLLYTNSKFFKKTFHGASVGISGHLNERTALGFFASFYNKDINPTFYNVGEPSLTHIELGIQLKRYILKTNRLHISPFLLTSWGISTLMDQSEIEYIETEFGTETRYASVDTNNLLLIQPGIDVQVKLWQNKKGAAFFLTTRAMYRQSFGKANYGYISDYNNFYFGGGLTIKNTYFNF